jgi:hypothetical protein
MPGTWRAGSHGLAGGRRHWNGAHWVTVPGPSLGFSILYGVSDVSARDALAVGTAGTGLDTAALALRWNGSQWVRP